MRGTSLLAGTFSPGVGEGVMSGTQVAVGLTSVGRTGLEVGVEVATSVGRMGLGVGVDVLTTAIRYATTAVEGGLVGSTAGADSRPQATRNSSAVKISITASKSLFIARCAIMVPN
jgi:hypothetical protein